MKNPYKKEMSDLVERLQEVGCVLEEFNDGDSTDTKWDGNIDSLMGTDEVHLYVRLPDKKLCHIFCVFGNSPGELVADYSVNDLLDKVTSEFSDYWTYN